MLHRNIPTIIILIITMGISCQKSSPAKNGLSDQDINNIYSFFKSHKENALAGDWAADALLYTEDAVRFPPAGDPIQGRKAIQEGLEAIDTVLTFTPEIIEIDGCSEIAYVLVKYSFTSIPVGSSEPVVSSGKSLMILKKQQEDFWKFHRVMWN
jgi:ketosteroid isomerase-like protein